MNNHFHAYVGEYRERSHMLLAGIYEALGPSAELNSRATFSLLSSLALLGVSLAGSKPESVQVFGFTIEAGHWLYLAIPLLIIVLYAAAQLFVAWQIERGRQKYLLAPKRNALRNLMEELHVRSIDEAKTFFAENDRINAARREIFNWRSEKQHRISDAKWSLLFDPEQSMDPNLEKKVDALNLELERLEADYQKKLDDSGIKDHNHVVEGVIEFMKLGKDSPDLDLLKECLKNIENVFRSRRRLVWLGLVVPYFLMSSSVAALIWAARFG